MVNRWETSSLFVMDIYGNPSSDHSRDMVLSLTDKNNFDLDNVTRHLLSLH
jgi:hypothetical protein